VAGIESHQPRQRLAPVKGLADRQQNFFNAASVRGGNVGRLAQN
jgi:hypothetical protein